MMPVVIIFKMVSMDKFNMPHQRKITKAFYDEK